MSSDVAVPASDQLIEFLSTGKAAVEAFDPQQAALAIVERILHAGSIEDVLKQQEAIHARDVLGQVLHLLGYGVQESDFDGSAKFYMLLNCVSDDGEPYNVTCGAINVMAQVYKLGQLNAFPIDVRIVENAKPTKAGYKPMWLEAVEPGF